MLFVLKSDIINSTLESEEEMVIEGYKAFHQDHTNNYGLKFEEGKEYVTSKEISYGPYSKSGFHMAKDLVDVFRFFPSDDIAIAKVEGRGNFQKYDDEYYGYFDLYAVEKLKILQFLKREEYVNMILSKYYSYVTMNKFLSTFKLKAHEKKLFLKTFLNNYGYCYSQILALLYHQFNQLDIYEIDYEKQEQRIRTLNYG